MNVCGLAGVAIGDFGCVAILIVRELVWAAYLALSISRHRKWCWLSAE